MDSERVLTLPSDSNLCQSALRLVLLEEQARNAADRLFTMTWELGTTCKASFQSFIQELNSPAGVDFSMYTQAKLTSKPMLLAREGSWCAQMLKPLP